ncbi:MAG: ABC transporter ATP-binding protein, partial [Pseudomonadota bacterium]
MTGKITKKKKARVEPSLVVDVLKRIFGENGRAYLPYYIAAIVSLLVIAVTTAAAAWIMRDVIDEIFVRQRGDLITVITGTVLLIFGIRALAMYFQAVLLARISNDLVARYQRRVFEKLLSLGVSFYDETRSAQLAARVSTNIQSISDVLSLTLTSFARDLVSLIGLVVVMFVQDPVLAGIAFIVSPLLIIAVATISRRLRSIVRETVELNARVIGTMQETVQGISVVKAFTMEEQLSAKLGETIELNRQRSDKLAQVTNRVTPFSELIAGMAIAGVIAYGGYRAIYASQPPGAMFAFITALLLAYDPAKRLARLRVNLEKALVNAQMIYEILDMPDKQRDRPDAVPLDVQAGEITFDDVHFTYGGHTKALHGLSFTAPANKTTAIVGPSGAGKTTVIGLIQRLHDTDSGQVLIDGHDIAGATKHSLRSQIAFVSQQPYLFEGTVADNIRYGRPEATDIEIEEAARLAYAHDFIAALPDGYDTPLGENGM